MALTTPTVRLLHFARTHGLVRPRDLDRLEIPRTTLEPLVDDGRLSASSTASTWCW